MSYGIEAQQSGRGIGGWGSIAQVSTYCSYVAYLGGSYGLCRLEKDGKV
ncbi:unnamed protein product, partial [marine sediment metagenome]